MTAKSVGSPRLKKGVMLWVSKSKRRKDKRWQYYPAVIEWLLFRKIYEKKLGYKD